MAGTRSNGARNFTSPKQVDGLDPRGPLPEPADKQTQPENTSPLTPNQEPGTA